MSRDKYRLLAFSMAHEANNALQIMIPNLERSLQQPDRHDLVCVALEQANLMGNMFLEMLSLAKPDADPVVTQEVFAIDSLLASIRKAYEIIADSNGIVLRIDRPDPDPKTVCRGDAHYLKQVLSNLVSNALKHTNPGDIIALGALEQPNGIFRFCVKDTGTGMSAETKSRLFQPFEQAPETASLGSGLGLYICRDLVTLMHGTIWAESELGKGSIFWFEVPLKVEDAQALAAAAPGPSTPLPQDKHTVLIVDDNPDIRKLVSNLLAACGAQCSVAATCCEGLHQLQTGQFELVMVDYTLGDGNGVEFIQELRKLTAFYPHRVHAALVTGAMPAELRNCDADSVLQKPFTVADLQNFYRKCFGPREQSGNAAA